MTKTTYSDEEIKQILQALFLEKKKTKELATKLKEHEIEANRQRDDSGRPKQEGQKGELATLKQLLALYKKKINSHQQELKEKEGKIDSLAQEVEDKTFIEEENHSLTLQVSFLKDSLKNLIDENKKLREKHTDTTVFELREQLEEAEALKTSFEKQALELIHKVHDLEDHKKQAEELQKKIPLLEKQIGHQEQAIQNLEMEKSSLGEQIASLKLKLAQSPPDQNGEKIQKELLNAKNKIEELEEILDERHELIERDKNRIEKLSHQLIEKDKRIAELLHLEKSLKKAVEQKQDFELIREKEEQEIQALIEEKKKLQAECDESKQHAEQLERVIQFLRERSEEARLEAKQWQEENQKAKEKIESLNQKLEETEENYHSLVKRLEEQDSCNQELQVETNLLLQQFDELKQKIQTQQNQIESFKASQAELEKNYKLSQEQNRQISQKLKAKSEHYESLEKEVHLIKQSLLKGLRESKELHSSHHLVVKDKADLTAKLAQSQNNIERQREDYYTLQEKISQGLKIQEGLEKQVSNLKKEILEREDRIKKLSQKHSGEIVLLQEVLEDKKEMERLSQNKIGELQKEKEKLENQLQDQKSLLEEKEAELNEAKQHFAKKVKEAALLEEKYEEHRKQGLELHQTVTQNKIKIAELQTSLELQTQQHKQLQDQLQESLRNLETAQTKWEEKYFALYDKWQAAEGRVKELEKIEEKQKHLQGLLSNIGSFFGTAEAKESIPVETIEPKKIETISLKTAEEKPKDPPKPYQSLFNMPKPPGRPRQSFLE